MSYIHAYDQGKIEEFRQMYRFDPKSLLYLEKDEAQRLTEHITTFYEEHLQDTGMDGYVVGLSGGIDSTTVAHLLVDAVGPENVTGIILPASHASTADISTAVDIADRLQIKTNDPEQFQDRIGNVVDTLETLGQEHPEEDVQQVKRGNILARCRMIIIRDIARTNNALVAGTTNASERDLGYMTLAADGLGGVDNEALYELYKTTERELAAFIGVDESIIERTPTADLWEGQEDQNELGFTYDILDQVLTGFRLGLRNKEIASTVPATTLEDVKTIRTRVEQNTYKNELPPHPTF